MTVNVNRDYRLASNQPATRLPNIATAFLRCANSDDIHMGVKIR